MREAYVGEDIIAMTPSSDEPLEVVFAVGEAGLGELLVIGRDVERDGALGWPELEVERCQRSRGTEGGGGMTRPWSVMGSVGEA